MQFIPTSTIVVVVAAIFISNAPEGVFGCAAKANASDPIDYSALKLQSVPNGQYQVVFVTGQAYNPDVAASALQLVMYKINSYAQQNGKALPSAGHKEETFDMGGKFAIRSLIDSKIASCELVKKFLSNMKPSFPDINYILVTCDNGKLDFI